MRKCGSIKIFRFCTVSPMLHIPFFVGSIVSNARNERPYKPSFLLPRGRRKRAWLTRQSG